ncbi:TetR/AcrR family transcriptional regulator [Kribbella endophytica]
MQTTTARDRNRRGQGERLREEIVTTAVRMLDELGDDQPLSMRAVAREIGVAATSVYLHFADRDELVLAALKHAHAELAEAVQQTAGLDPAVELRARILVLGSWASDHPGLYKVLTESTLNQRADMSFRLVIREQTAEVVRRCMDAGLAPADDPTAVAFDLRAAVHGVLSMRVNQPDLDWPPLSEQVDRYLVKLVGLSPGASNH